MLPHNLKYFCSGTLVLMLIAVVCAAYAYFVNARRAADDLEKQKHYPVTILLAPVTLPLLLALSVSIFAFRVLVYGVLLILFPVALLIVRKPFLLVWLHKIASYVGNQLLDANRALIKVFLKSSGDNAETI